MSFVKAVEGTMLRHCSHRGYNFYNFWKLSNGVQNKEKR